MTRTKRFFAIGVVAVAAIGSARSAAAQGYGLYEQGACAMALAGAGVADPCQDASAVFFNPAALAATDGTVFSVGGTLVGPFGDFTSDAGVKTNLIRQWIMAPNAYYARSIGSRAKFGFGVMAPYGLEIGWPDSFEGRVLAYDAKLQAVYIQPTVAFKVNDRVMVGGGLDISIAKVELGQRADLSTQVITGTTLTFAALGVPRGTDFADIRLKGDAVQAGFHLGVLLKPSDRFSVGARYLSKQTVETDEGDFTPTQINTGLRTPVPLPGIPAGTSLDALLQPQFAAGARLATQSVSTSIPLPDQFVVGFMVRPVESMKLKVDYQFTNWSLFDTLVITTQNGLVQTNVEDYKDTHGIRVGTEFNVAAETRLRAGILAHGGAAPEQTVTPLLPEGERVEFTLGGGHQLTDRIGVDMAYQYLYQPNRRGRVSDGGLAKPTAAVNSGEYAFRANLLAMNLTFKW